MADDKAVRAALEKACVNCGKEATLGHGDICVKFLTFVCHTCKSAHQSFSHRCKSVTMSNWTMEEVQQLSDQRGGGNLVARATWLGALDNKLALRPDDALERTKDFVNDCYNYKRYWKDADLSQITAGSQPISSESTRGPRVRPTTQITTPSPATLAPPPKAQAPQSSFMDFDADFNAAPPPTGSGGDFGAFTSAPPSSNQSNGLGGGDSDFDFIGGPAPAPAPFDPFGAGPPIQATRTSTTAPATSGFDFMQAAPPPPPSSFGAFDPFSAQPPHAPPRQQASSAFGGLDFGPAPTTTARPGAQPYGLTGPPRPAMAMNAPPVADPFAVLTSAPRAMPGPVFLPRGSMTGGPPPPGAMGGGGFGPPRGGQGMMMMGGGPPRGGPAPMMMMPAHGGGFGGPPPMARGPMMMMPGGPHPARPLYPSFLQAEPAQKEPDPFEGLAWGLGK